MRQKELLQARLVAYMGESEDDRLDKIKKAEISNKKISESEVILLDYSSEEKDEKSRKRHRSDSRNVKEKVREQKIDEKRKDEKAKEVHRSRKDNDNRYKEDLRKEIDRDKVRFFREREKIKDDRRNNMDRRNNTQRGGDMNKIRRLSTDRRDYSREDEYRQDRGRNRYSYQDKNRRGRNVDQKDKFKGSLSEGLKDKNSSSSGSEMDITDLNDEEDDEEKIIALRRKQRMELLKKLGNTSEDNGKYIDEKESSSPIVSQNIENYELNDGTLSSTETEVKPYDSLTPPFPPGIKADVSSKEIIDDKNSIKNKEIKKSEWDMFAEQDIDSNFDVSFFSFLLLSTLFNHLYF